MDLNGVVAVSPRLGGDLEFLALEQFLVGARIFLVYKNIFAKINFSKTAALSTNYAKIREIFGLRDMKLSEFLT